MADGAEIVYKWSPPGLESIHPQSSAVACIAHHQLRLLYSCLRGWVENSAKKTTSYFTQQHLDALTRMWRTLSGTFAYSESRRDVDRLVCMRSAGICDETLIETLVFCDEKDWGTGVYYSLVEGGQPIRTGARQQPTDWGFTMSRCQEIVRPYENRRPCVLREMLIGLCALNSAIFRIGAHPMNISDGDKESIGVMCECVEKDSHLRVVRHLTCHSEVVYPRVVRPAEQPQLVYRDLGRIVTDPVMRAELDEDTKLCGAYRNC